MFSLNLGTLAVHIRAFDSQYHRALKTAEAALKVTSDRMIAIGRRMTYAISLPLAGIAGLSVKLASDAEEIESKFRVTFSSIRDQAIAAMDELDRAYGMNATEAQNMLAMTGDLLTGFGFEQKAALDLSLQVSRLAVDLASFQNLQGGAKRASESLTKALLGERESAKLLGVVIREEDVKARILENRKKGLRYATDNQAKAYATLQIAQEQSKNAMGDYARTSQSFANQWREMTSDLKQVGIDFGRIIMPQARAFVQWLKETLAWFRQLNPETKKLLITVGAITAAVGPLMWLLGGVGKVIQGVIMVFSALGTKGLFALGVIGAGVLMLIDLMSGWRVGFLKMVNDIEVRGVKIGWRMQWIATYIWQAWDYVVWRIAKMWEDLKLRVMNIGGTIYRGMLYVAQAIARAWSWAIMKVVGAFSWLAKKVAGLGEYLGLLDAKTSGGVKEKLNTAIAKTVEYGKKVKEVYGVLIQGSLDSAEKRQEDYFNNVTKLNKDFAGDMKTWETVRDQILEDSTWEEVKSTDAIEDFTKQWGKMMETVESAPRTTGLASGSFKEISLRRISIAPATSARTQKQEVHDETVAGKLDVIAQLLSNRRAATAVLG